jgi:hypothetical protein
MFWISLMVGSLVLAWTLLSLALNPGDEQAAVQQTADVAATNFIVYHQHVSAYFVVNRSSIASGDSVPLTSISFPPSYAADAAWGNVVIDGVLYTYSGAAYRWPAGAIDVVNTLGRHVCVRPDASSLRVDCGDGPHQLPTDMNALVPAGGVVVIGS